MELEERIKQKFETKREKITVLKEDLSKLMKLYKATRKTKADKTKLLKIAQRMEQIRAKIAIVR